MEKQFSVWLGSSDCREFSMSVIGYESRLGHGYFTALYTIIMFIFSLNAMFVFVDHIENKYFTKYITINKNIIIINLKRLIMSGAKCNR